MISVLYLGIEGIIVAQGARTGPQCKVLQTAQAPHSKLLDDIAGVIATLPRVVVVLNGWSIVDIGYRNVLSMLPTALASKTVGATIPGNRMHRRVSEHRTRADILRADIRRRDPASVTILDASKAAIPFEFASRALLVSRAPATVDPELAAKVTRLLTSDLDTP